MEKTWPKETPPPKHPPPKPPEHGGQNQQRPAVPASAVHAPAPSNLPGTSIDRGSKPSPTAVHRDLPGPSVDRGSKPSPTAVHQDLPGPSIDRGSKPSPTAVHQDLPGPSVDRGLKPSPTVVHQDLPGPSVDGGPKPSPTAVHQDLPGPSVHGELRPSRTAVSEEQDKEVKTLFEPFPSSGKRKESAAHKFFSKVPDMLSSRRGSKNTVDGTVTPVVKTENVEVAERAATEEQRRRSSLRRPSDVGHDVYGRRKSQVYNPFTSFEKHVSISATDADVHKGILTDLQKQFPHFPAGDPSKETSTRGPVAFPVALPETSVVLSRQPSSRVVLLPKTSVVLSRPTSSRALRRKSIPSVADLTKQDISVCFFPEEPDWGDDDDWNKFRSLPSSRRVSEDEEAPELPKKLDQEEDEKDTNAERARWDSRLVYLLALISYSISFGNVYHFPALIYRYGIPFLIPYTFFTVVMGYPLHFLESSLGQYSQSGPVKVWDCAPIARGLGWSMFLLCLFIAYFYNMYAAYALIYFSRCFKHILPWQDCDTPRTSNFSCVPRMCARSHGHYYTPAEHYFFDHMLQVTYSGKILEDGLGKMNWAQVLGFLLAWVIVYFSIIQSVKSIGKVVFCLVVFPYFVLIMLLAAGFMLEGSVQGIYALFTADFIQLLNFKIWKDAAEQVFFELGVCQGTPLAYASYCHYRNPTHINSAIICVVNYFTSILCTLVIFNILGALSLETGLKLPDVIHQGPALIYIVYPEALSRVPGSRFWCVAFFLMLFSVAIGTQIAVVETVMTIIFDEFKNAYSYRWIINLLFCTGLFSIGLILCTSNGFYIVHLLSVMTSIMPRLPIAICMVSTILFIYGITKFCEDMHFMLDYYPNLFIRLCLYVTPFILFALIFPSWLLADALSIMERPYVIDAIAVGWFSIGFILIWIILGAIYWYAYCKHIGHSNYIWRSLTVWGPRNLEARIARTEFSSDNISNFNRQWTRKSIVLERKESFK